MYINNSRGCSKNSNFATAILHFIIQNSNFHIHKFPCHGCKSAHDYAPL